MLRTGVSWHPSRAGLGKLPAGLGWGMLNLSGKVRLVKVYLGSNYKDCHNVTVFPGTAKMDK